VILRVLNFLVIGALVLAAAYVYRIKFEATVQAERLAKLRGEVQHARDKLASLRAQWGDLDDPARIQELVKRFLKLRTVEPAQFDDLAHLPDRPPDYMGPGSKDPIGGMIEHLQLPADVTGDVSPPSAAAAPTAPAPSSDETPTPAPPPAEPPPALAPAVPGAGR
jgi:hypothetical protein